MDDFLKFCSQYLSVLSKFSAINLKRKRNFPGGPVVKNLPSSAGDASLIPGQGTKIPHAVGELRSHTPWGN